VRGDPTFWLIARASGLLAYALVSATIVAGLVLKGRPLRSLRPAAVTDLHGFLSLLSLMAVALHGVALMLDSTVEVSAQALVVPGLVPYRPLWTGVGVAVAELMLLVHLSFRFRKRIGVKNWRRLHWATYGVFAGATAHGLMSGTDSARSWALAAYSLAIATVVGLTAWRATTPRRRSSRRPSPAPSADGREAPREDDLHKGPAPDGTVDADLAPVGLRHRLDDREAEPCTST
jgi:sulfoxide reductase heme-binding subunit YedZ